MRLSFCGWNKISWIFSGTSLFSLCHGRERYRTSLGFPIASLDYHGDGSFCLGDESSDMFGTFHLFGSLAIDKKDFVADLKFGSMKKAVYWHVGDIDILFPFDQAKT